MGACASPRERLYVLADQASNLAETSGSRATVLLGPVSIPREVDRPQIVLRSGSNELIALEQERWAAPLKDAVPKMFAAELNRQLPDLRFVPIASAAVVLPQGSLALDIVRLDVSWTRGATIDAHWVYRSSKPQSALIEGDAGAQASIPERSIDALVDSLRVASARVAQQIAAQIR